MPACFSLTKKGETKPAFLPEVDDEMREHFGAPADKENWFRGWYDTIGLGLAMGASSKRLRELLVDCDNLIEVLDWLEENYDIDSWYEHR